MECTSFSSYTNIQNFHDGVHTRKKSFFLLTVECYPKLTFLYKHFFLQFFYLLYFFYSRKDLWCDAVRLCCCCCTCVCNKFSLIFTYILFFLSCALGFGVFVDVIVGYVFIRSRVYLERYKKIMYTKIMYVRFSHMQGKVEDI